MSKTKADETARENGKRKIGSVAKNVVVIAVAAVAVFVMIFTVVSVAVLDRNDRNLFGLRMYIVLSDSMSATDFRAGDVVVVRSVDPASLQPGDVISFQSLDPETFGETVTHKIRRLTTDGSGRPAFVTYGTTTNVDDKVPVSYEYVYGKYCFRVPGLGNAFRFLRTPPGYIFCILLPFLLLIGLQVYNSVMIFRKYKAEQTEKIGAEKAELEAERAESQRLLLELQTLKAELARRDGQDPPAGNSPAEASAADSPNTEPPAGAPAGNPTESPADGKTTE